VKCGYGIEKLNPKLVEIRKVCVVLFSFHFIKRVKYLFTGCLEHLDDISIRGEKSVFHIRDEDNGICFFYG